MPEQSDQVNPKDFEAKKMVAPWSPPPAGIPGHLSKEATVTMVFPHKVSVQLDDGAGLIHFKEGIQEVPVSLQNHWYLQQNKVVKYSKPEEPMPEIGERHVKFLQSQGHSVSTVAGAKKFILNLDADKRRTFFAAADWQASQEAASSSDNGEEPEVDEGAEEPETATGDEEEPEVQASATSARRTRRSRS